MTSERSAADMTEGPSGASPDSDADHDVGLVVVSHSRSLARAAVALADEMLHGRAAEDRGGRGPRRARRSAPTPSASWRPSSAPTARPASSCSWTSAVRVLSAELALDLLHDPAIRDRVTLSPAPIVEGLIVAAVAAAGGASRAEVAAEARDALHGQGRPPVDTDRGRARSSPPQAAGRRSSASSRSTTPTGCTPGRRARLVSEVRALDASVQLRNLTTGVGPVPAGSLSRVATLAALQGHQVEVRASGPQAQEAVEHLLALARRRFDETVDEPLGNGRPRAAGVGRVAARRARCRLHRESRSGRRAG